MEHEEIKFNGELAESMQHTAELSPRKCLSLSDKIENALPSSAIKLQGIVFGGALLTGIAGAALGHYQGNEIYPIGDTISPLAAGLLIGSLIYGKDMKDFWRNVTPYLPAVGTGIYAGREFIRSILG